MDRGTYSAASAGLMQFRKLEVVSNNLANVNTAGFKRQGITGEVQTFDETFAKLVERQDPYARPDHQRTPGTVNVKTVTDFSLGAIRNTDNDMDVALRNPNDFFVVQTPAGTQYTRAGNFSLGSEGQLITQDGLEVQGDGGPISVEGGAATIGPDGSVRVNKVEVGRLRVVRFATPSALKPAGGTRYTDSGGSGAEDVQADVVPRALEMANVSVTSGVIDLMTANRGFSMYTKASETIDSLNQTSINQYGRRVR